MTRVSTAVASLLFGLLAASAYAQVEASVSGRVADETKSVLPGATITATDLDTGRQAIAVSGTDGQYRLKLSPGAYRIEASLPGFSMVTVSRIELLVGQNATVPFDLKVAGVSEALTVVAETPLVDITSFQVAGNVDRRQMEELPIQGRNWMELSKMVKGITANDTTTRPGVDGDDLFQLNLDGQQVSQKQSSGGNGQPKFSREAIAEFQIVTNLFDITQGRSAGIQVQAISKSGTNTNAGSVYGYFRSDKLNAPDLVAHRVLPYSDQQVGGSFGGPIVRDRMHYFASYEYERNPFTLVQTPSLLPGQRFTNSSTTTDKTLLAKVDNQLTSNDRLSVRVSRWDSNNPFNGSGNGHPSQATVETKYAKSAIGTWSKILGQGHRVQEVSFGWDSFNWVTLPQPSLIGSPQFNFPGLTIGTPYNQPSYHYSNDFVIRYALTAQKGKHDIKLGGELHRVHATGTYDLQKWGIYMMSSVPNNLGDLIPADAPLDQSKWNIAALNPFVRSFDVNFSRNNFADLFDALRPQYALWFGDSWRVTNQLTINLGIRWDADPKMPSLDGIVPDSIPIDGGVLSGDFGHRNDIRNLKDVAPRVGFNYNVGGRNDLVIRGGSGLFYGTVVSSIPYGQRVYTTLMTASFANDGRPDFVLNPTNGKTGDDFFSGRVPTPIQSTRSILDGFSNPYTWQSSIGFQKQINSLTGLDVDLTHNQEYRDTQSFDVNLFYDPATGYQKNPATGGRPNRAYDQLLLLSSTGYREQTQLASGLTRRLHKRLQAGATYTYMFSMTDSGGFSFTNSNANNVFDLDAENATANAFQRHTGRFWALYGLPGGISASVSYFYGSGNRYGATISGQPYGKLGSNRLNLTNAGGPAATITIPAGVADRFDGPSSITSGTIIPRNALKGLPLHKVDLRLTKDVKLGARRRISLIGEVFNLFNHANYGSYSTSLSATNAATTALFGQPNQNLGTAFVPRSGQLGVRFGF